MNDDNDRRQAPMEGAWAVLRLTGRGRETGQHMGGRLRSSALSAAGRDHPGAPLPRMNV